MITVSKFSGLDSINVFSVNGRTNVATGNKKFQEDVKHLLETPLGTVLGNLSYGSNLYQYVYLPANQATGTLIQEEIRRRIEDNYSDIKIDTVDVTFEGRAIYVSIGYSNNNSNVVEFIDLDFEGGEIND